MKNIARAMTLGVVLFGCGSSGTDSGTGSSPAQQPPPAPTGPKLAQNLTITGVAVFQATKADVVATDANGNTAHVDKPKAPVIAGRPGMLRVYVQPGDGWEAHKLRAELHVFDKDGNELPKLADNETIAAASTDAALDSTFNFLLEEANLIPDAATYRVVVFDDEKGAPLADGAASPAQWPNDGSTEALGVHDTGDSFQVKFVPIEYDADNSGRLPDTSDKQIGALRDRIFQFFPTKKIDVTIREPLPWKTAIEPEGQGWDQLLQGMSDLKSQDNAPANVWYVALFESYPTITAYGQASASGGAVLGVGTTLGETDPLMRIAAIVGYPGKYSVDTLPQELAHTLGQEHAPCGNPDPSSVDTKFPYPGGRIGVWGYDVLGRTFIDPNTSVREYMSYCFNSIWTSDYTYNWLAKELAYANRVKFAEVGFDTPRPYRFVTVKPDGSLAWGRTIRRVAPPTGGAEHTVTFLAADGSTMATATAHFGAFSNLRGGMLQIPEGPTGYANVKIEGLGMLARPAR